VRIQIAVPFLTIFPQSPFPNQHLTLSHQLTTAKMAEGGIPRSTGRRITTKKTNNAGSDTTRNANLDILTNRYLAVEASIDFAGTNTVTNGFPLSDSGDTTLNFSPRSTTSSKASTSIAASSVSTRSSAASNSPTRSTSSHYPTSTTASSISANSDKISIIPASANISGITTTSTRHNNTAGTAPDHDDPYAYLDDKRLALVEFAPEIKLALIRLASENKSFEWEDMLLAVAERNGCFPGDVLKDLKLWAKSYAKASMFCQLPGEGHINMLVIAATIPDPTRKFLPLLLLFLSMCLGLGWELLLTLFFSFLL